MREEGLMPYSGQEYSYLYCQTVFIYNDMINRLVDDACDCLRFEEMIYKIVLKIDEKKRGGKCNIP